MRMVLLLASFPLLLDVAAPCSCSGRRPPRASMEERCVERFFCPAGTQCYSAAQKGPHDPDPRGGGHCTASCTSDADCKVVGRDSTCSREGKLMGGERQTRLCSPAPDRANREADSVPEDPSAAPVSGQTP